MGGCQDCRQKRRVEREVTPTLVVVHKRPATSLTWYVVGLALGWYARGAWTRAESFAT